MVEYCNTANMDNILEITKLSMHFPVRGGMFGRRMGTLKAVDDVSLSIAPGETLGLVGESGCGKSTIGRCIVRLLDPTSGTIRLLRKDITHRSQWRLRNLRSKVQMVFQDPAGSLNPRMTVRHLIAEPMIIQGMGTRASRRRRVDALLELVGLTEAKDRRLRGYSKGMLQRIGLAQALVQKPRLLVLDEPTAMLDPRGRREVVDTISQLNREKGITVVLITHHMDEAAKADRVVVLHKGKIAADGCPEAVFSQIELLHELGLAAPETVELCHELNGRGFDLPLTKLDPESCAQALLVALKA